MTKPRPGTDRGRPLSLDPQSHLATVWAEFANVPGEQQIVPGMIFR